MKREKHVSYTPAGNAAGGSVQERVALSLCELYRAIICCALKVALLLKLGKEGWANSTDGTEDREVERA